jgi:hypothetical protein
MLRRNAPSRGQRAVMLSYAPKTSEKALEVVAGVGTHVRSQPVAPAARQVVDQRDVAEAVAAAPVDAVGLEGVAAIGDEYDRSPAGSQHPGDLLGRPAVVGDVLQHLVGEDKIEGVAAEWQVLTGGLHHAQPSGSGLLSALAIELDAKRSLRRGPEVLQVQTQAATVVEHASVDPLAGGLEDPAQPAFLPGAPDVRWLAAQRSARQVPLAHPSDHSCWKPKPRRLSIRRTQVGWKA